MPRGPFAVTLNGNSAILIVHKKSPLAANLRFESNDLNLLEDIKNKLVIAKISVEQFCLKNEWLPVKHLLNKWNFPLSFLRWNLKGFNWSAYLSRELQTQT